MTKMMTAAAALSLVMTASAAQSSIFQIDYHDTPLKVWQAYDPQTELYSMRFMPGQNEDGFWLVVSDGPNPRSDVRQQAILYGDLKNNRLTAYTYDGNGERSFETGEFLGVYNGVFKPRADGKIDFALDVSDINNAFDNPEWEGVQFDDQAGIWFHRSSGTDFEYDEQGRIRDYAFSGQTWLDRGNDLTWIAGMGQCGAGQGTTFDGACVTGTNLAASAVSAPGGLALLLAGFAGLFMRRRR